MTIAVGLLASLGVQAPVNAVELERQGSCSKGSIWKADIELEYNYWDLGFEVNTRSTAGTWRLLVKQNGRTVENIRSVAIKEWDETTAEVDWSLLRKDTSGSDKFFFSAKNLKTGEICRTVMRG